jgi:hypothetical protein
MSNIDTPATERKVALAPDLRGLSERAMRAWVERMAVGPLGDQYVVESESGGTYVVDPVAGTCTCPDHRIRGETCKHLRRVAIEITAQRVPPPGKRRAGCGACGTETFVDRDADPPALCSACSLEPDEVVLDRETGSRLVVVEVTDRRADEVEIAATETTVAEYPTNEGYPQDDLVVEAVYVSDAARRDDPTRYSFPLSRLRPTDDAAILD